MKLHLPSKKFILSTFSALIAFALLLTVVPTVSAEDEGPLTPIPGLGRIPNATLVRMHKQLGGWYGDQEDLLKKAVALSARYQDLVTANADQQHSEILQEGLATFNAEIEASRQIHLVAGASIYSLAGFKANGDVRDRLAAGQQIIDGRASLRDANFRLNNAIKELKKNFAQYRQARRHPYVYKYP